MTKPNDNFTAFCQKACEELQTHQFNKDIDPRTLKESYNLFKQTNNTWFKSTKQSLHDAPVLEPLDLNIMPALKNLTNLINELDFDFNKKGGRIFITENLVYKIKKGTQTPIIFNDSPIINNSNIHSLTQKLCIELQEHGLLKDRYRTEETYMLAKTANGEWSTNTGHENHSGIKTILLLAKMPLLKMLASKINKEDSQFQSNGGRIFITPTRIYRIKNKVEINFKF
ncbi:MAG: hypothetical protein Q7U04_18000 [Bacteriovorax sp.]|nr:hypothetical protein [Bacteriovorax sp.]